MGTKGNTDVTSEPQPAVTELTRLRQGFLRELPQRIDVIHCLMADLEQGLAERDISRVLGDLDQLHQRLHKLIGAAGTFGLSQVSGKAREMSDSIDDTFKASSWPTQERIDLLKGLVVELSQSRQDTDDDDTGMEETEQALAGNPDRDRLVHIVDDDPAQLIQMRQVLLQAGYKVDTFSSVAIYSDMYESLSKPDVIVMDMRFDGDRYAGAEYLSAIKKRHANLPPVVFVSVLTDIEARLKALRSGATRYLAKPVRAIQLVRMADDLTRRTPHAPYRVMMVDDDTEVLAVYGLMLSRAGMEVLTVSEPLQTLERLEHFKPDVLILDMIMPDVSGSELATLIREDETHESLPILFLSADTNHWRRMMSIGLGGDEFLPKPVAAEYLITTVSARARRARRQRYLLEELQDRIGSRPLPH